MSKFAKVIVNIRHGNGIYTYKIPEAFLNKIQIGMRVIVPFGFGNKNYEAYVVNIVDEIDFPIEKAKDILSLTENRPLFSIEMLKLAKFMRNKYYCTFIECLNAMKPTGMKFETEYVIQLVNEESGLTKKSLEVVKYIKNNDGKVVETELLDYFGNGVKRTIKSLEEKNVIDRVQLSKVKDLTQRVKVAYINYDIDNFDEVIKKVLQKNDSKSKIINYLMENEKALISDLISYFNISKSPIKTLEKHGLIVIQAEEILRNINYNVYEESKTEKILTKEQQDAVNNIYEKLDDNEKKPILLFGVTGSGKTEVYIKTIEKVLKDGKQAIVLVPEIALTPQTVSRFVNKFGDKVGIMHSRLSAGERFDEWKKARDNKISIMIGARSAIFTPFENIGVIIIDEEHESTYKSEITPKYDAREVAKVRCDNSNALLILGSATPSINSFYKAKINEYNLIKLENRVNNSFPNVNIVDMREQLKNGNKSIFSMQLHESIMNALEKNEQVMLFLNKRGASSFISCRNCGYVVECEDCSVSMTYHSYDKSLMCHYCGKKMVKPKVCPQCNSEYIKYFGIGTQKVEEEAKKIYNVEVARMDFDTTSGKDGHSKVLERFRKGEAKILVGTQMIAKGLDFPNVTVVGVIAGDMSINNGDYRSGETTFQLLTQVAGRAGRAHKNGNVFIQTYNPEHYSIVESAKNDYNSYYEQEISLRDAMKYPPFSSIFIIMITGENEKEIIQLFFNLKEILVKYNVDNNKIYNPTPAIISKIKKRYRWKIIVKGLDETALKNYVIYSVKEFKERNNISNVNISLNLNPNIIP